MVIIPYPWLLRAIEFDPTSHVLPSPRAAHHATDLIHLSGHALRERTVRWWRDRNRRRGRCHAIDCLKAAPVATRSPQRVPAELYSLRWSLYVDGDSKANRKGLPVQLSPRCEL